MTDAAVVDEGGGALTAGSAVEVARPVGQAPRIRFRHVLTLTFELPAAARPVVGDTALRGTFRPLEHDALHPGRAGIPAATLDDVSSHPFAAVSLPGPRELLSVTLSGVPPNGGVGIYRLDGSTPSSEPTVTGTNGTWVEPGFVDVRFAVGADGIDGPAQVGSSNVQQVSVRAIPTGPALGVALGAVADAAAVTAFWRGSPPAATPKRAPAERPSASASRTDIEVIRDGRRISLLGPADVDVPFDVGGDLRKALTTALDAAAPGTAVVSLVLEADQPCAVEIDELTVTYRAVITTFDEADGPLELTFTGATLVERDATITLPEGSNVTSATLQIRTDLRSDRMAGAPGDAAAGGPGLELIPGRLAAGTVDVRTNGPPRATAVSGLVVSAVPMEDGTEMTVALQEDRSGSPSGADLARSAIELGAAGTADHFVAPFASALSLSAGRYWAVAQATRGRAVWLADPTSAGGPGTNGAPTASIGPAGGPLAPAPGRPRVSLLTADADGPSPLRVSVDGTAVDASPPSEGQTGDEYGLTASLRAALEAGAGPVTVRFASASSGKATVEPRVEFELPG